MLNVQSPAISNALREALALDGGGGFPMAADQVIVPVAVVADVRESLNTYTVNASAYGDRAAVAAEYALCSLTWPSLDVLRILVHRVHVWSTSGQAFYWGLSQLGIGGAPGITMRRKLSSLLNAGLAAQVQTATTPTSPPTLFTTLSGYGVLQGLVLTTLDFTHAPFVLDAPGHSFIVGAGSVNTQLAATFEWTEEVRQ